MISSFICHHTFIVNMEATPDNTITIQTNVQADIEKTWNTWNTPEHIMQWNNAVPEWHTPRAENDLREDGQFNYRMEARDGSFGFDFSGTYDQVQPHQMISYTLDDGRKVKVTFSEKEGITDVTEVFEVEDQNSIELQRTGWQAILDNFKRYTESR
jgi:uncharacterized protein YndB with AHSA1/START domain